MRLSWLLGLSALTLAPAAGAQSITEAEFLSGITAESAAVRALTEGVARAEAARKRAGVLPNPWVDFWREQPDANPRVTNWTLGWTPPLDGRYRLGKKAPDAGLAAARERFSADNAGLRRDVRAAYAAWSLSFERRDVLKRQLERVRGLAEVERQRARVGEESGLSARRFTLAEAEVRSALGAAEAEHARAVALVRAWRPDLAFDAVPATAMPPDPPAITEAAASPELQAVTHEAEQAALERKRVGPFLGFPTLQLGWQQISDGGAVRSGPIFAAGWTIPLYDRDQAERVEAERRPRHRSPGLRPVEGGRSHARPPRGRRGGRGLPAGATEARRDLSGRGEASRRRHVRPRLPDRVGRGAGGRRGGTGAGGVRGRARGSAFPEGAAVADRVRGFITLFGIATRNGVLLVSHYEHLMRDEGLPLREAVVRGSHECLAPVLMTALTAGLALIPLVLAGDKPGNEIQSPMAEVILGGLLSSTFLNLVVVPVLFARWGTDLPVVPIEGDVTA